MEEEKICLKLEPSKCGCGAHTSYYPGPTVLLQYVQGQYYHL